MFDIGFSELVVIAVVALIVLGPERLPKAARTMGHLFGRLQRYVNDVKSDISREMELEELRKLQQEVKSAATEIEQSVHEAARGAESGLKSVENELNSAGADPAPAVKVPSPHADVVSAPVQAPPADLVGEPPAESPSADIPPSRQGSLPGFDRI